MSNQLVSNLTINELKELITNIIDTRIDNLVKSSQALEIRQVQDNPLLKIASVHKDNPLSEKVSNSIEADHHVM